MPTRRWRICCRGLNRIERLDNTLVLITSDESSGLMRAASDVDREVSQNWGLLVAITPEGAASD